MKLNLKSVLAVAIMAVMILSLAACGGNSAKNNDGSQTTSAAAETTAKVTETQAPKKIETLKLTSHASWFEKPGAAAVFKYINDNPEELGVTLEFDKLPEGGDGENVLFARVAAGESLDLLYWQGASAFDTRAKAEDNLAALDGEWIKDYDEATIKASPQYSKNGTVYMSPFGDTNTFNVLYNKKVFEAAGVSVPNNWDEFLKVCEAIKAKGITPVYISGKDAWTTQLFPLIGRLTENKQKSPQEISEGLYTNKIKYVDLKSFQDTMTKYKQMLDLGYIQKTWLSDTYAQAQQALLDGQCGIYAMGSWVIPDLMKLSPEKYKDIGAFGSPYDGNSYVLVSGPGGIFVPKSGKNPELAKQVASFMSSNKGQELWFKASPGIPYSKGLNVELEGCYKDLYDIIKVGNGWAAYDAFYPLYSIGPFEKYCQDLLVGQKTAEEVCKAMDSETAKSAKAKEDPNWK